jgi:hypothetical protein
MVLYLHFCAPINLLQNCSSFKSYLTLLCISLLGFNITSEACCGFGKYKGWFMCLSPEMACSNASNYIWWDQFHPTDTVNGILAANIWNGEHTKMCYPLHLQDMVTQKAKWQCVMLVDHIVFRIVGSGTKWLYSHRSKFFLHLLLKTEKSYCIYI